MNYIGIDGCKSGWFYIGLHNSLQYDFGITKSVNELETPIQQSIVSLIDIPIGLREKGSSERECDKLARGLLRLRRSSVFPAPSRLALQYSDYKKASMVNYEATGRKLSKQSWWLSKKINEVDNFLENSENRGKIRETHPEICFWALNNQSEMNISKKIKGGLELRLNILSKYYSKSWEIYTQGVHKFKRNQVARDDIVDALAIAISASFYPAIESLPQFPEKDARGIPMEIVIPKL